MERESERPVRWAHLGWVLLFYVSLMLPGLGSRRALTQHEVFAAEPAREMLHGATWVIQTFGGVPRYEKPPAMSWMIAGCFALIGEGELAARVPSVAGGGIVLACVMVLAGRQYGVKTAVVAGLMQATMFYTLIQARLAESDMPMLAAVTVGMTALALAWVPDAAGRMASARRRAALGWLFAVSAGVACLLKPPAGVAVMLVGAMAFAWAERSWAIVRWVLHPGRVGLFLLIGGAWPLAAWWHDPQILHQWRAEAGNMTGARKDQRQPWHFYLWNVPMMALPWMLYCIPLLISGLRARRGLGAWGRFAAAWIAPGMLLLSCSASKHKHYCLPLLPPLTVWCAAGGVLFLRRQHRDAPRFYPAVILGWAGLIMAGMAVAVRAAGAHPANVAWTVGVLGAGGVAVLGFEWARRERWQWVALFATAWAGIVAVDVWITPAFENDNQFRAFARQVTAAAPKGQVMHLVGLGQSQLAFYLDLPVHRVDRLPAMRPAGQVIYAVMVARSAGRVEQDWGMSGVELMRGRPEGENAEPLVLLRLTPQ